MTKEEKAIQAKKPSSAQPTIREAKIPINNIAAGVFAHEFSLACISFGEVDHFFLDATLKTPIKGEEILVARIIMAPLTAKLLRNLLEQAINDYEKEHGEVKIPSKAKMLQEEFREQPEQVKTRSKVSGT
jgi:hypothetical protein